MASPRATPPLLKDLNERTVLDAIRDGAPVSRAEISRRVGISKPTVSQALQSLLDAGLVREAADDPGGPRYGALFFEPVPEAALVLGLDLGARFLRGAICDLGGEVRARQDVELVGADAAAVLEAFGALRDSLADSTGLSTSLIDTAVVGVPAVVETATGVVGLTNVEGLDGMHFADAAAERLGVPVIVDNDTNLAAVGEQWLGVARGLSDFVFLSIGTGLGAGLVLGGEVHRGHNGAAGEVDLVSAGSANGDIDPCAGALSDVARGLASSFDGATAVAAPFDPRDVFGAARAGAADRRRGGAPDRPARRPDRRGRRRGPGRPRRRAGNQRRPSARARARTAARVAPISPARRGFVAGRGRGADGRAGGRPASSPGQRLPEPRHRGARLARTATAGV